MTNLTLAALLAIASSTKIFFFDSYPVKSNTFTTSGAGLLLKTFTEIKDYKTKIEMCKFVYTTYEKVLVDLRASLRGDEFNRIQFINEMRLLYETIFDLCPLTDTFEKQYNTKFTSE